MNVGSKRVTALKNITEANVLLNDAAKSLRMGDEPLSVIQLLELTQRNLNAIAASICTRLESQDDGEEKPVAITKLRAEGKSEAEPMVFKLNTQDEELEDLIRDKKIAEYREKIADLRLTLNSDKISQRVRQNTVKSIQVYRGHLSRLGVTEESTQPERNTRWKSQTNSKSL